MRYFKYQFYVAFDDQELPRLKITDGPAIEIDFNTTIKDLGWIYQNIPVHYSALSPDDIYKIDRHFLSGIIAYSVDEHGKGTDLIKHFIILISAHDPEDADINYEEFRNDWTEYYSNTYALPIFLEDANECKQLEHSNME